MALEQTLLNCKLNRLPVCFDIFIFSQNLHGKNMPYGEQWAGVFRYSNLGFTFAANILIWFFGGYWLDGKIGTVPLLTILGTVIGAVSGFIYLIRALKQIGQDLEAEEKPEDESEA